MAKRAIFRISKANGKADFGVMLATSDKEPVDGEWATLQTYSRNAWRYTFYSWER